MLNSCKIIQNSTVMVHCDQVAAGPEMFAHILSLIKMVVNFASRTGKLNRNQLEHSIRRNFGGFDPETGFDPMDIFREHCTNLDQLEMQEDGRPPIDSIGLVESSLSGEDNLIRV